MDRLARAVPHRAGAESQRGQALPLLAAGMIVLLLMAGLVVDGGNAFLNRREAQNTSDLAALAGTKVISDHYTDGGRSDSQVNAAISEIASRNGCGAGSATLCTWSATYIRPSGDSEVQLGSVGSGSIPTGAQGVLVTVNRQPQTFFLGLVDQDVWDIEAEAVALTARIVKLVPPGQLLPIGIDPPNIDFQPGGIYNLTQERHDAPGNFSFLSWDGDNSAPSLAYSLCNPDNEAFTLPVWMDGDPGKSNSSGVRACINKWIADGTTMLIPLWDEVRGTGNNVEYHLTGIAAFVLTGYGQQAVDNLTGRFVEYYQLPTIPGSYGGPPCRPSEADLPECASAAVFMGLSR